MYFKTSNEPTFLYPRYIFFHKETRITVLILNRQHVFHLESETLWCSGYKKKLSNLVSPSPDRQFMLCYWASYFIERLCLFLHLVFVSVKLG